VDVDVLVAGIDEFLDRGAVALIAAFGQISYAVFRALDSSSPQQTVS
jgi:hypothetical protein